MYVYICIYIHIWNIYQRNINESEVSCEPQRKASLLWTARCNAKRGNGHAGIPPGHKPHPRYLLTLLRRLLMACTSSRWFWRPPRMTCRVRSPWTSLASDLDCLVLEFNELDGLGLCFLLTDCSKVILVRIASVKACLLPKTLLSLSRGLRSFLESHSILPCSKH